MNTKNTQVSRSRGIYESAYDAFTNYMNILGDFMKRVESLYPIDMDNEELNSLLTTIRNQGAEIESLQRELSRAQAALTERSAAEPEEKKPAKATAKKVAAKKPAAKKTVAKKAVKAVEE